MQEFSIGRRRFTVGAAAAAAAALIRPAEAIESAPAAAPAQPPAQAQSVTGSVQEMTQKALAKLTPQAQAEVEVKVANVFRKYGEKLSAEQKADIRRVMAEGQEGLEKIRAFVLENGDQPATVFKLYRKEGK
jgi:uncharacterized protein YgbK (DUF1537 family)